MTQRQAESRINPMLLLDPILDELKTVVDYHGVTVQKVSGAFTVTVGYRGDLPVAEVLRGSFRGTDGEDGAEWVRQNNPKLVADILGDTPEAQSFRLVLHRNFGEFSGHMRSYVGVALAVGDRPIGSLGVDHRERGRYTPRDLGLLQAFVERRRNEIEHAILYADAARLADEAQAVLTVQQAIVLHRKPDAILRKVAEEVLRLTAARRALVFLSHGQRFRLASAAGPPAPWLPAGWGRQRPVGSSLLGKALEAGKAMSFYAWWYYFGGAVSAKLKFVSFEPLLGNLMEVSFGGSIIPKADWVIIGSQTKPYNPPKKEWVQALVEVADEAGVPVFLKDNLKPLLGNNLRQELPAS